MNEKYRLKKWQALPAGGVITEGGTAAGL